MLLLCSVSDARSIHILIDDLITARQSAGWSQGTLAERIGVSAQVIYRLERGIGSVPNLVAAMEALNFRLTGIGPGRTVVEQLRARRLKNGKSLDWLAGRTGLSRNTIASVESGGGSVASLLKMLAVLARRAKRRAPERAYWGAGDKIDRDSRFTPPDFLEHIYAAFGRIDIDPCAHELSPVIAQRRILLAEGGDGLLDDWSGRLAFVNPPYSATLIWLKRAYEQWTASKVETVVCLVPMRTDSQWFQDVLSRDADIFSLRGRVRFLDTNGNGQNTPFSLMLATLGASNESRARFAQSVPGFWWQRRE